MNVKLKLLLLCAIAVWLSASTAVMGGHRQIFPSDDAYVDSANPAANYGNSNTLYVGDENWNTTTTWSYLKFDLSTLPAGASITSAKVWLYVKSQGGGTNPVGVSIYLVNDDAWTEGTINWNNKPGHDPVATDTTPVQNAAPKWRSWDVTADAQLEQVSAGGDDILSEVIRDDNEGTAGSWAGFDSEENPYPPVGYPAYLYVEYTGGDPDPCDPDYGEGAVSFSVNGKNDPHYDGVPNPPAAGFQYFNFPWAQPPTLYGAGPFPATRQPAVPQAMGIPTYRPGDVWDYLWGMPIVRSDGEIFQSEPNRSSVAGGPSNVPNGTNNQILKADAMGLMADHSNINAYTFGEDYFNDGEGPSGDGPVSDEPWEYRDLDFDEPKVGGCGLPIKLYFSVDPWAIGLPPWWVQNEATVGGAFPPPAGPIGSVDEDLGAPPSGIGPWNSNGEAAGDVFSCDPILAPGINVQEYDELILALWGPQVRPQDPNMEDDLDALECVGHNTASDGAPLEPGNTHDRVAPTQSINGGIHPPDLGAPNNPNHDPINAAPIIFSVDRGTYGNFGSAVHAQLIDPCEGASGDLFIAVTIPNVPPPGLVTTNMLLVDEGQLGLMPYDDLDAVIVHLGVDPCELADQILEASTNYNPVETTGSKGYGFTIPLLNGVGQALVGFSVDTSSIGLMGTAVDFECRMDGTGNAGVIPPGSGVMEQAGDIFFSNLTPPRNQQSKDKGTGMLFGTNYLWFEEINLGLDRGIWTFMAPGPSGNLADLPDELNALDSIEDEVEEEEPCVPGTLKWWQPPDDSNLGIDIRCDREDGVQRTLADDYNCTMPGPITHVRIWGSWKNDYKGTISNIHLSIHKNIPDPDPGDPQLYSMPGDSVWEGDFGASDFNETLYHELPCRQYEYWWDPFVEPDADPCGDKQIWQYDIYIDKCEAFWQQGTVDDPCIYWLDVWVDLVDQTPVPEFGWKTTPPAWHFEDDAVRSTSTDPFWAPLVYPPPHPLYGWTVDMAFAITTLGGPGACVTYPHFLDGDMAGPAWINSGMPDKTISVYDLNMLVVNWLLTPATGMNPCADCACAPWINNGNSPDCICDQYDLNKVVVNWGVSWP